MPGRGSPALLRRSSSPSSPSASISTSSDPIPCMGGINHELLNRAEEQPWNMAEEQSRNQAEEQSWNIAELLTSGHACTEQSGHKMNVFDDILQIDRLMHYWAVHCIFSNTIIYIHTYKYIYCIFLNDIFFKALEENQSNNYTIARRPPQHSLPDLPTNLPTYLPTHLTTDLLTDMRALLLPALLPDLCPLLLPPPRHPTLTCVPSSSPPPDSRLRCSSLSRSDLRHLARRFWNQTCEGPRVV